jgi:ProQ/FINO family
MKNQTRADEGRGLAEMALFGVGCVNYPDIAATSPASQARPKRRNPYYAAALNTLVTLRQRFPLAFARLNARKRPPLKVGIRDDIIAAAPEIDGIELGRALRLYTGGRAYVENCVAGAQRIGLDGQVAGIVTAGEARWPPKGTPPQAAPAPAPTPPPRLTLAGLKEAAMKRKLAAGGAS